MTEYFHAETKGALGAPLVFTFHGTGADETQFHELAQHLVPNAHVISPRGDVSEQGMARFFRRTGEGVYDMEDLAQRRENMARFLREKTAMTGAGRVIALGYSNGANIATAVALDHPDIFSDVIAMHPLIPWTPDPQPGLSKTRWLLTSGRRDPICPPERTQALSRYLSEQGAEVSEHQHPGGHEIAQDELVAISTFVR